MLSLFCRYLTALIMSVVISSLFDIECKDQVIQTLFTVIGIAYSIAISNIIGFKTDNIVNVKYRNIIKNKIKSMKNMNTIDFSLSILVFISSCLFTSFKFSLYFVKFNISMFVLLSLLFSLFYIVFSFKGLQQLSEDVSDRLYKEKNKIISEG
jgi:hypothetical protein|nr:MAG TPA_asm: hypothetical protein [Caudoviricetes sp.]